MTTPGAESFNAAGGSAHGFTQAQNIYGNSSVFDLSAAVVHGDVRFEVPPGATAADKYLVGVEHLRSGMAPEARRLIWEAMMEGYQTSAARFHWLIAMLSGRMIRQFAQVEIAQLKKAQESHPEIMRDLWEDASRLVFKLLASTGVLVRDPKPDISLVISEFDRLGAEQRDMLLPHLELFLEGPLKDNIWSRERSSAEERQLRNNRTGRAWMFFQPIPRKPDVHEPDPIATTARDRRIAWACIAIFVGATGFFGWELLWHTALLGFLAYVIALTGGAVAVVSGLELRFLAERHRHLAPRFRAPSPSEPEPRRNGRPAKVDALFNKYAATYVSADERAAWKAATAGVRRFDRDEIVAGCRENKVAPDTMAWLVRYRVRQSREKWKGGTLYEEVTRLRPKPGTVLACRAGLVAVAVGSVAAIAELGRYSLPVLVSVIVASVSAICAWRSWVRIDLERRRYTADMAETTRRRDEISREFRRWSQVLDARPADAEMAAWLDYDRTMLLGMAMDRYKLPRHQVITYAFLEERGKDSKQARYRNGPMRYSRYTLIVFLLTSDGVRQAWADLKFLSGRIELGNRLSYRYDAVVSAHVQLNAFEGSRIQDKFTLTLVNGDPINVTVADLDTDYFQAGEDVGSLNRATLEAASVTNTLHVLEGIAAEGKRWFDSRKASYGWATG